MANKAHLGIRRARDRHLQRPPRDDTVYIHTTTADSLAAPSLFPHRKLATWGAAPALTLYPDPEKSGPSKTVAFSRGMVRERPTIRDPTPTLLPGALWKGSNSGCGPAQPAQPEPVELVPAPTVAVPGYPGSSSFFSLESRSPGGAHTRGGRFHRDPDSAWLCFPEFSPLQSVCASSK